MSKEEFHEPIEEEVNRAVESAKKQMDEYYESQPTTENVNRTMRQVAARFGEKFEAGDPTVPEDEIIEKLKKEGWNLIDVVTNAAKVTVSRKEGKKVKVVGLGDKFLIFEKKEEEI